MTKINDKLYTAAQVRGLDNVAIHEFDIAGYELMCRAGKAVMAAVDSYFPKSRNWLVLCGPGNNGGDGYVVARLAAAKGCKVTVCSMIDPQRLSGDAAAAYKGWCEAGGQTLLWPDHSEQANTADLLALQSMPFDLVIDALLGTGIERATEGSYKAAIEFINAQACPVVAVDIPSGLNADTGCSMGAAVRAQLSVSFVGKKRGMFTADGIDYCGAMVFDGLDIPAEAIDRLPEIQMQTQSKGNSRGQWVGQLMSADYLAEVLLPRLGNSHKGSYGEVVAVGGAKGMSGAILLTGEAALRSGAGKVRLATDPEHAAWINLCRPELMVTAIGSEADFSACLKSPQVLAVGPGLGHSDWADALLRACLASALPLVMDADALNWLAQQELVQQGLARQETGSEQRLRSPAILTPHPAEAARLLGISTSEIQRDRVVHAQAIAEKFQATVVLKGSGSVIAGSDGRYAICPFGNPGMATAGSGDVLTGIIAALLAQRLNCYEAACAGVLAHALAGDLAAARHGEMAMLAGDITQQLENVWQQVSHISNTGST